MKKRVWRRSRQRGLYNLHRELEVRGLCKTKPQVNLRLSKVVYLPVYQPRDTQITSLVNQSQTPVANTEHVKIRLYILHTIILFANQ